MILSKESPIHEIRFYDESLKELSPEEDKEFQDFIDEVECEDPQLAQLIEASGIDKPEWFKESEASARRFLATLGFSSLKQTVLVKDSKDLVEFGFDKPVVIAVANKFHSHIIVREPNISDCLYQEGPIGVGATLAHEFSHDTAARISRVAVHRKPEEYTFTFRSGFSIVTTRGVTLGDFYEEGFAQFMSGWYKRARAGDYDKVIDINEPSLQVPPHLAVQDQNMTAGPDGYAIELLAWGLEKRGTMHAADFIATMLETRRSETQVPALRTFAQAVESLRPGLYRELQRLEYGRNEWIRGLAIVHATVTEEAK